MWIVLNGSCRLSILHAEGVNDCIPQVLPPFTSQGSLCVKNPQQTSLGGGGIGEAYLLPSSSIAKTNTLFF